MAFFDDFTKKVGKAAQIAAKKSSDLVEITKLNANISSQEDHIKDNYRKMGEICFKLFKDGQPLGEDLTALCNEIVSYQDKIASLHEKIAEIKAEANASSDTDAGSSTNTSKSSIIFDQTEEADTPENTNDVSSQENASTNTASSPINFDKSSN